MLKLNCLTALLVEGTKKLKSNAVKDKGGMVHWCLFIFVVSFFLHGPHCAVLGKGNQK